jgi:hypothetical protein
MTSAGMARYCCGKRLLSHHRLNRKTQPYRYAERQHERQAIARWRAQAAENHQALSGLKPWRQSAGMDRQSLRDWVVRYDADE